MEIWVIILLILVGVLIALFAVSVYLISQLINANPGIIRRSLPSWLTSTHDIANKNDSKSSSGSGFNLFSRCLWKKQIVANSLTHARVSIHPSSPSLLPTTHRGGGSAVVTNGSVVASPEDESKPMIAPEWEIPFNKLKLKHIIGKGNFGEVWLATWLGSPVAVKTILPDLQTNEKLVKRFLDEIQLMSTLHHPNVVMFLGACTKKPNLSLTLEYCVHGSLHHFLKNEHIHGVVCTISLILRFALDIARGVYYLHRRCSVVQRDLKARNVLIDISLNAKVADFGLSRVIESEGETNKLTACGTPAWTAPEIVRMQPYTEKVDVYSFGIILFELIAREEPYRGQRGVSIAYAAAQQGLRPEIPSYCIPEYADLMRSCWADDPALRPSFAQILKKLFQMKKACDLEAAKALRDPTGRAWVLEPLPKYNPVSAGGAVIERNGRIYTWGDSIPVAMPQAGAADVYRKEKKRQRERDPNAVPANRFFSPLSENRPFPEEDEIPEEDAHMGEQKMTVDTAEKVLYGPQNSSLNVIPPGAQSFDPSPVNEVLRHPAAAVDLTQGGQWSEKRIPRPRPQPPLNLTPIKSTHGPISSEPSPLEDPTSQKSTGRSNNGGGYDSTYQNSPAVNRLSVPYAVSPVVTKHSFNPEEDIDASPHGLVESPYVRADPDQEAVLRFERRIKGIRMTETVTPKTPIPLLPQQTPGGSMDYYRYEGISAPGATAVLQEDSPLFVRVADDNPFMHSLNTSEQTRSLPSSCGTDGLPTNPVQSPASSTHSNRKSLPSPLVTVSRPSVVPVDTTHQREGPSVDNDTDSPSEDAHNESHVDFSKLQSRLNGDVGEDLPPSMQVLLTNARSLESGANSPKNSRSYIPQGLRPQNLDLHSPRSGQVDDLV